MATSKLFKKVPLTAPNRSGFNMSHNNFFSAPVGTLVPNLIDFLIPGDEIDLGSKSHIQLPPMATDFYGRIEYKEEAFFVPCRILFGGWKDFFVNPVDGTTNPSNIDGQLAKYLIGAKLSFDASKSVNFTNTGFSSAQTNNPTYKNLILQGWPNSNLSMIDSTIVHSNLTALMVESLDKFEELLNSGQYNALFGSAKSDYDIFAGSLLDYLGFKIGSDFMNIKKFFTEDFLKESIPALRRGLLNSTPSDQAFINIANTIQTSTNGGNVTYSVTVPNTESQLQLILGGGLVRHDSSYLVPAQDSIMYFSGVFFRIPASTFEININNILPLMAYHKIYDDWYRAPQIQQSLFKRNVANSSTATSVANMPWITSGAQDKVFFSAEQLNFANGHNLFDLHQRNWQKDFFTSMTPEPQAGEASSVKFDIVDNSGEFTIASLRAANALQQWLDRNNIGGFRYGDMIYAQYGVYPSDAITDRAIYLGSSSTEVYNKSVYQHDGNGGENTNNPFNAIGSKYASPSGVGQGSFCNNYRVTEAGFVVKIGSLVPQAYYSTGVRRMFHYNDISDIAFPVLAGVGDQEVFARELIDIYTGDGDKNVLGYQQRYAEYKFIDDQVHGKLRDGESLSSFALQRSFSEAPQLGSEFLQIPRDYLDQVSATDYKLSDYGCWVNCYNDYRKSSTLPAYSIPTLEDMKGHTILVDKGGNYIA